MVLARDPLWEYARAVTPAQRWFNPPQNFTVVPSEIVLQTQLGTNFWQRIFYDFRNDNAPVYLFEWADNSAR
jgi:regulation of enolase protein 1 (concanavalin A-like superfamily)